MFNFSVKTVKKKFYLLAIIALTASVFISCSSNGKSSNEESAVVDSNTVQQAVVEETVKETVEEATEPETLQNRFLTQDLRMYNLFGKVKNYKINEVTTDSLQNPEYEPFEPNFSFEYDADGHFKNYVSYYTEKKYVTKMDGDKIIETKEPIEDFGDDVFVVHEYAYDANGFVKTENVYGLESVSTSEYTYNEGGELVKVLIKEEGEGSRYEEEQQFIILERDANKNWTKRFKKIYIKEGYICDTCHFTDFSAKYKLQTRTINYW